MDVTDIYQSYAAMTGSEAIRHERAVDLAAIQLGRSLVPVLTSRGIPLQSAQILELGAGWGRNLLALKKLGARHLCGVDISEGQVSLGRRLGLEDLRAGSALSEAATGSLERPIDVLLLIDFLEHLSNDDLMRLSDLIQRIVKPGGLVALQVPNDLAPANPVRAGDLTHLRAFTPESVDQFFRLSGLEKIAISGSAFAATGMRAWIRRIVAKVLVFPALAAFYYVLYGRTAYRPLFEPNIFAVAMKRQSNADSR